ncbi:MAG: CBS domain-containing protein [Myxococcota bacterium]
MIDADGSLVGFFTDGDLRRQLNDDDFSLDTPIEALMHRSPKSIGAEQLVDEAASLLRAHTIDQVPVVDESGRPIGLFDIQDLLSTKLI